MPLRFEEVEVGILVEANGDLPCGFADYIRHGTLGVVSKKTPDGVVVDFEIEKGSTEPVLCHPICLNRPS